MISRTNGVLAGLFVLVMMLAASTRVDYSRPNVEILPDMKYTPAWTTFSRNPNFKNGRTLQAPVPGTIARGQAPLHYEATKEDAVRAGEELQNPYVQFGADQTAVMVQPVDNVADDQVLAEREPTPSLVEAQLQLMQSVDRGSSVYRVFCTPCHGALGVGDGVVTTRGFPPPPSLLTGNSVQAKDGQLFHILTYGQGNMSGFAGQLSSARRWDVINYVRSLQRSSPATPAVDGSNPAAEANSIDSQSAPDTSTSPNP